RAQEENAVEEKMEVETILLAPKKREPRFVVEREGDGFRVRGPIVERWAIMTDFDNPEGIRLLYRRLRRIGVEKALLKAGAEPGDVIRIGDIELEFMS